MLDFHACFPDSAIWYSILLRNTPMAPSYYMFSMIGAPQEDLARKRRQLEMLIELEGKLAKLKELELLQHQCQKSVNMGPIPGLIFWSYACNTLQCHQLPYMVGGC